MTTRISKRDADVLRYIRACGSVWVITTTPECYAAIRRLVAAGLVRLVDRPRGGGADAVPA